MTEHDIKPTDIEPTEEKAALINWNNVNYVHEGSCCYGAKKTPQIHFANGEVLASFESFESLQAKCSSLSKVTCGSQMEDAHGHSMGLAAHIFE